MNSGKTTSDSFSVLIVDDDPTFRALLKVLLETCGCHALEARSSKDADLLLREFNPSLLIVDYRLPGLDGIQWITTVRAAGYNTPIIFLSGTWCDLKAFNKLRSILKVNLILQKPIVPELFLEQIESLLPRALVTRQGADSYEQPDLTQAEPSTSAADYSGKEAQSYFEQSRQHMDARLTTSETFVEHASVLENVSAESDQTELRSLFENEILSTDSTPPIVTPPLINKAFGRDAMRRSGTRIPAFVKPDTRPTPPPTKDETPSQFANVALSRDNPEEMEIIKTPDPNALEQLARFNQKAAVEMALRNARTEYAKVLPEKVEALAVSLKLFKENGANIQYFDEVVRNAHQLKGTAGSLGFPHLGKTAGMLESLLLENTGLGDASANDKVWTQLERQLEQCVEIAKANAARFSEPATAARTGFTKKVALIGPLQQFADLTRELAVTNIAEAYLLENMQSLLDHDEQDRFNCVIIDSAVLNESPPTRLLQQVRRKPWLQSTPFVFILDEIEKADQALWLYTGAECLLPQTVPLKTLKELVESMLVLNQADKPRVLTIDDDLVLTNFICDTLSSDGISAKALNEPIKVLEALSEFRADLILLDVVMPGVSGYDVCRLLRADKSLAHLPILFLTSKNSQQGRAAAFRAGANDFLAKPILTEELLTRVRGQLELSSAYRQRAGVDNQTGFTTRQAFLESLTGAVASAMQTANALTVVVVGIDKFEELALSFGFTSQEQIFKDLVSLLQSRFRVRDLRGHWSEGSFALAFPNIEPDVIHQALKSLAGEFAPGTTDHSMPPEAKPQRLLRYGLAELPVDGITPDTLLSNAFERCVHSAPIDVSEFSELCSDKKPG